MHMTVWKILDVWDPHSCESAASKNLEIVNNRTIHKRIKRNSNQSDRVTAALVQEKKIGLTTGEKLKLMAQDASKNTKNTSIHPNGIPQHILSIIANMTGCVAPYNPLSCTNTCQDLKYRLINGACNNRNHPSWGASNTVLSRWLPSQYEDGLSEPKGWNTDFLYMNFSLPPVREVTNKIIHASNNAVHEDSAYSHIIIEWGQYIDHDMAFTPQSINKVKSMCGSACHCANEKSLFSITVITIRDYIPKILGPSAVKKYIGIYKGYDENINPSISNIFSTAAFRFGHATIPPVIYRLDSWYKEHSQYPSLLLNEVFFRPWRIIKEGGLDPLIRGLLGKPAKLQTQQEIMNEELTEKLLVLSNNGSMDLASLNLQRGRDHGLPGYNDWREFCGLSRLNSIFDMKTVISEENTRRKMLELYGHPDNIDVWLGGLVEDLLPGGRTGPLFACLIGMQIRALRDGDRFWYESTNVFTEKQKLELERHSLSRVICDNTELTQAPPDSFLMANYPEGFESCDNIPSMNLDAWKENQEQGASCGLPKKIKNGDFAYCSETLLIYFCYPGYRLVGHEKLACLQNQWNTTQPPFCKDIDECSDRLTPPCHASATCRNTLGSYECLCTDPYELAEDNSTYSGKLPRASIASIILVALLFLSWAVMCWFLVCRREANRIRMRNLRLNETEDEQNCRRTADAAQQRAARARETNEVTE
ncbi:thyroid peroxidase [Ranitomeya imitator]|uniref:thyroid peroxidase n=1 Tax=Ranitomeya imitator TaxID=111125 RepID=UPI0037E81398